MKRLILPILAALLALSSYAAAKPETSGLPTLNEPQKTKALHLAKAFLRRAIVVRKDGTASALHARMNFRTRIEWRNLVFRQLILGTISNSDRKKGISRRMYAQLHSDSYRTSTDGTTTWSKWSDRQCSLLPSFVMIEEIDGRFHLSAPDLAHFSPTKQGDPISQPIDDRTVAKN